jgi:hypothetical protein
MNNYQRYYVLLLACIMISTAGVSVPLLYVTIGTLCFACTNSFFIVCFVNIGGIVDHHCLLFVLLILVELLTIIVYCLFCWYWWNCWPSLFIVCFVNIGGIVDHHCLLFVLLILVELLTIIIYCLFCWYWWNCWRSLFIYFLFIISNGYEKNIHMTKDQFKYIHSAPNMSTMQSHYNL